MKIFLDFDDMLFDSVLVKGEFVMALREIYTHGGWSADLIKRTSQEFSFASFEKKPITYSIEKHLALLEKEKPRGTSEKVLAEAQAFMGDLKRYVFPDVISFLERYSPQDLFIITYGDPGFQKGKISGSGIRPFFKDVLIIEHGAKTPAIMKYAKTHIITKSETIVFVDDKAKYFDEVNDSPYTLVKILLDCRGSEKKGNADYRAENFDEVAAILEQVRALSHYS